MSAAEVIDAANSVSTFIVGAGSPRPCLGAPQVHSTITGNRPGEPGVAAKRRVQVTIESMAAASSEAAIHDLQRQLRDELAGSGRRITILENLGVPPMVFRAYGEAGGPEAGYPRVDITFQKERSVGLWQFFTLSVETVELLPGAGGVVIDDRKRTRNVNRDSGDVTLRETGTLEMDPAEGVTAEAYAQGILDDAFAARVNANGIFTTDISSDTADPYKCTWTYSDGPPGAGGGGSGGLVGRVNLRQRLTGERAVEAISEGAFTSRIDPAAALAAALGARPSLGPGEVRLSEEIDGPSDPDGRVGFRFAVARGKVFPGFADDVPVIAFRESISIAGGGAPVRAALFELDDPVLYLGARQPIVYSLRQEIEYAGSAEPGDLGLPSGLDAANESGEASRTPGFRGQVRTLTVNRTFVYATRPDPEPAPRLLDFIGSGLS